VGFGFDGFRCGLVSEDARFLRSGGLAAFLLVLGNDQPRLGLEGHFIRTSLAVFSPALRRAESMGWKSKRGALILRLHGSKRSYACALSECGLYSPHSKRAPLHVCIKESAGRLITSHYVFLAQESCPPLLSGHAPCETSKN
jgi:hypothetical protein